jgi:hypothetical protein
VEDLLEADQVRVHAAQLASDPRRLLLVLGGAVRLFVGIVGLAGSGEVEDIECADLD